MSIWFYLILWLISGIIGYLLGRYPEKAKALWGQVKEKFNA